MIYDCVTFHRFIEDLFPSSDMPSRTHYLNGKDSRQITSPTHSLTHFKLVTCNVNQNFLHCHLDSVTV